MSGHSSLTSNLVIGSVGCLAKLFLSCFTHCRVNNLESLLRAIHHRPVHMPLLTFSNHTSTMDDPFLWGILPPSILFNSSKMRWSLGAEEILFKNRLFSAFFGAGQVLPTRRGDGIMQPSVDEALSLMADGRWIHVFPEGRVVPDSSGVALGRLKWGIGRLILEAPTPPLLLPIIHQGFEHIKPYGSLLPRFSRHHNALTVSVGEPIDSRSWLQDSSLGAHESARRSALTERVRLELSKLYLPKTNG